MKFDQNTIDQARQKIHSSQRFLIVSHIRPDGDAVGSVLGMGLALQAAGKDVQMVLADGVPASFHHLMGSNQILSTAIGEFDCICFLDSSDINRVGKDIPVPPDLSIDHHITNLNYAKINIVDPKAAATAQILTTFLPAVGLQLSKPIAEALLTGIITDTIGFCTSNVTPEVLRLSADLMDKGANLAELYRHGLLTRSFEAVRLWGRGLNQMERDGRVAWATLTLADRKNVGYPGRDDADLINVLTSINDIDIAVIFVEQSHARVKVSWRAQPGWDVSKIALLFGGGGHPAAAGADIPGDLTTVKSSVLQAIHVMIDKKSLSLAEKEDIISQ